MTPPTPHFLAITEESHDASTVHGIYSTFIEARDDIERRIAEDKARPYSQECGIDNAQIQEWADGKAGGTWERYSLASMDWTYRA